MSEISTDNQTTVPDPAAAEHASRRMWRWMFTGVILIVAATIGAYGYRVCRHAQLFRELQEYNGYVETTPVYSNWADRALDESGAGQEQYFRRIGVIAHPRNDRQMPAELISRLARDSHEGLLSLQLADPELTLQAACDLAQAKRLYSVEIRHTGETPKPFSAEVLSELAKSNSLELFWISNAGLPPETFATVSRIRSVRELHLVFCDVSLDDLASLKKLPNLRSLSLWVEDVNDERLLVLDQFEGLRDLSIWSPNTADDLTVYEHLRRKLSGCAIYLELGVSPDVELEPWNDPETPTMPLY